MKAQPKPRVPPFRELPELLKLLGEKTIIDEKAEAKAKKKAAEEGQSDGGYEEEKQEKQEDMQKYKILESYDFPTYLDKSGTNHIVDFDKKDITLYEIFDNYGTMVRPKENPKYDPKPPPPKEKKPPKIPTPKVKKEVEEGEEGEEGAAAEDPAPVEPEEPEEQPFIPPLDKELWYDFSTHNGQDPILLALMIKGPNDEFTL